MYARGWLCPWEASWQAGRRRGVAVVSQLLATDLREYGLWNLSPVLSSPCWALGRVGGWTSVTCHLILRQVSAHLTARRAQALAGASCLEAGRREGRGAARPRRRRGVPGCSWLHHDHAHSLPQNQGSRRVAPEARRPLSACDSVQVPLLSGFRLPYLTLRGRSPVLRGGLRTRLVNLSPGTRGHSSVLWHH